MQEAAKLGAFIEFVGGSVTGTGADGRMVAATSRNISVAALVPSGCRRLAARCRDLPTSRGRFDSFAAHFFPEVRVVCCAEQRPR